MARFSERMGITSTTIPLQINEVNKALRTALWNGLGTYYFPSETDYLLWSRLEVRGMMPGDRTTLHQLWIGYLNWPYDELGDWACVKNTLKDYFFSCQWFEVLDLIEFVGAMTQERVGTRKKAPPLHPFVQYCNDTLAHHNSAYRFVGGLIAPISADHEIAAVEDAIAAGARSRGLMPIQHHIQRALQCLADRQSPDYANSMKEAISAVEALCKLIAGLPDATLGQALNAIQKAGTVKLHASLKTGLHSLYSYTCDADGIRHALKDDPTADQEDALFMLVTCSAFVNYLVAKAQKAGITL